MKLRRDLAEGKSVLADRLPVPKEFVLLEDSDEELEDCDREKEAKERDNFRLEKVNDMIDKCFSGLFQNLDIILDGILPPETDGEEEGE